MARGDAPDSATTSFFICTGTSTRARRTSTQPSDESWTGWRVVDAIEATPRDGEAPRTRIELALGEDREAPVVLDAWFGTTRVTRTATPTRYSDLDAIAWLAVAADDRLRADSARPSPARRDPRHQ